MTPGPAWRKPDNTNDNPRRALIESRSVVAVGIVHNFIEDLDLDLEHVARVDLLPDRMNVEITIPGHGEVLNTYFYTEPI